MADLGNLTSFLKEGSVPNLDWLTVDEKEYRELDTLPKQNLDMVPDLDNLWSHSDTPQAIVPNREPGPKTLSELSQAHSSKLASDTTQAVVKVARLALMQSTDMNKFRDSLVTRFDHQSLVAAREPLTQVLQERGLLGRVYLAAMDFPECHKGGNTLMTFVKKFATPAKFVVRKNACEGCVHGSSSTCAVFQKKLVVDVPYTQALADEVESYQSAQGKVIQASAGTLTYRDRVKSAFLAKDFDSTGLSAIKPTVDTARFLKPVEATAKVHLPVLATQAEKIQAATLEWSPEVSTGRTASLTKLANDGIAFKVAQLLQREMLKGHSEASLLQALRVSFSLEDLKNTRASWEPLFKEAGLFGTVYATQEAFDSCSEGSEFLSKFNPTIKGIVESGKCPNCTHNKMAKCGIYGKPLVAQASDLYTPEVLRATVQEGRVAGKVGSASIESTGSIRQDLKNLYRKSSVGTSAPQFQKRANVEVALNGFTPKYITSGLTKRDVTRTASRYLNEGLYGSQLLEALQGRFDPRDIAASSEELKTVLAEQGLQGIHFVDPTVYSDYGKGCDEGARLHRANLVPYVKIGTKCDTCMSQSMVGKCSKYSKSLVVEPPYQDKVAQQAAILNSGKSTDLSLADLMIPNKSIVAEFALKTATEIEINPVKASVDVNIQLGGASIKL